MTNGTVLGALYFSMIAISYFTFVSPGSTYVTIWLNDVLALLNGSYRVFRGQVPSVDFHSVHGPLVFFIPALGLRAGLEPSAIFAFGSVAVAAFVLLAGWLTMFRRFPLLLSIPVLVFLCLLIVVPMPSGRTFQDVSWGTFYNRHGWAALAVVFLFHVEPEERRPQDKWLDSIVLASLVLFLVYTKITFGIVAVAFVLFYALTDAYNRTVSLIAFALAAAAVGVIQLLLGFNVEYARDILTVSENNRVFRGGLSLFLTKLIEHAWIIVACAGALLIAMLEGRRRIFDWAYVFGAVGASMILLETTGGTGRGLPALIAVFVCCAELARRAEIANRDNVTIHAWSRHAGYLTCGLLAAMFMAEPVSARLIVWHDYYLMTARHYLEPLPGLPPSLSGFIVPVDKRLQNAWDREEAANPAQESRERVPRGVLSPQEYLLTIIEGTDLLRKFPFQSGALLVLDNADPFTVALGMRPGAKGYPLFWAHRIFSMKNHPPARDVFHDIDWVMVPELPHEPSTLNTMMEIYGEYLRTNYAEVGSSRHWRLLARRPTDKSNPRS